MDLSTLRRLADEGLAALPPTRLADLGSWCWDWGVATGDARYCVLSRTFRMLDDWWDTGVPYTSVVDRLDAVLARELPSVLDVPGAADGSALATHLHESAAAALDQW